MSYIVVESRLETLIHRQQSLRNGLREILGERFDQFLDSGPEIWLPYLSIEGFNRLITKLRSRKIHDLYELLLKFGQDHGAKGPWDHSFPSELLALPVSVLFQYKRDAATSRFLKQLTENHCTRIAHLKVFSPKAWSFLRGSHTQDWIKVSRLLE